MSNYKFIEDSGINYNEISKIASIQPQVTDLQQCLKSEGVDLPLDIVTSLIEAVIRNCEIYNDDGKGTLNSLNSTIGKIEIRSPFDRIKYPDEEELANSAVSGFIVDLINNSETTKFEGINIILDNIKIIFKEVCIFINDLFDYIYDRYYEDADSYEYPVNLVHHYVCASDNNHYLRFTVYGEPAINKPVINIEGKMFVSNDMKPSLIVESFSKEDKDKLMAEYFSTVEFEPITVPDHEESES